LSGRVVAHVHGGDRALGQCDDTLRHAITKLAHLHFPATRQSAARVHKLGERCETIFTVGTPGLDDIAALSPARRQGDPYAVVILHPEVGGVAQSARQARLLLRAVREADVPSVVLIDPNNDAGWQGITGVYDKLCDGRFQRFKNLARAEFLRLLGGAGLMIGNSSSGIIEAASFGVRVVNVGTRQQGRECGANVTHVDWDVGQITAAIRRQFGRPYAGRNCYGSGGAGAKIAAVLSDVPLTDDLRHKLIRY
jgi:UDP-hydrolysing UDP-N-acetyl-D-glucosamine 2-epimerase